MTDHASEEKTIVIEIPEAVGVFPIVDEPPTGEFPLAEFHPGMKHYVSMEDSPHAKEVLGDLVSQGYVQRYTSLDHLRKRLGAGIRSLLRWR